MRTLILCGGKGTRAYPHTLEIPKPLMEVGDAPILAHVMEIYARQGYDDFVLAAGYRADLIQAFADELTAPWSVEVIDTGLETGTGGRVLACAEAAGEVFLLTYGDGLGSVDLGGLVDFHNSHPGAVTVTAVPLPSPYGTLEWDEQGKVRRFLEKPRLADHWINAGFFVIERRAFEHFRGDDLEREILPLLVSAGELYVYKHHGFWRSMDTYKDALELTALCSKGEAPWMTSPALESSSPERPGSSDRTSPGA